MAVDNGTLTGTTRRQQRQRHGRGQWHRDDRSRRQRRTPASLVPSPLSRMVGHSLPAIYEEIWAADNAVAESAFCRRYAGLPLVDRYRSTRSQQCTSLLRDRSEQLHFTAKRFLRLFAEFFLPRPRGHTTTGRQKDTFTPSPHARGDDMFEWSSRERSEPSPSLPDAQQPVPAVAEKKRPPEDIRDGGEARGGPPSHFTAMPLDTSSSNWIQLRKALHSTINCYDISADPRDQLCVYENVKVNLTDLGASPLPARCISAACIEDHSSPLPTTDPLYADWKIGTAKDAQKEGVKGGGKETPDKAVRRAVIYSGDVSCEEKEWVEQPVFAMARQGSELSSLQMDGIAAYVALGVIDFPFWTAQFVAIDGHPAGPFASFWSRLFPARTPIFFAQYDPQCVSGRGCARFVPLVSVPTLFPQAGGAQDGPETAAF
ncbi:unnamed protein product [Vitrella brassicaformis CCMP3155]|uniref:Uncharacterized protein n=1 Tax=Vitrella brassicaformis (strain CCMP3155) TaxID=1169540 RepID=A0A0G4GF78_VITBC|nr:unnamed protein product [Vitrella brassicaformis CCMP3155]|eukprot:CEM28147.1 unnamed protein product [Vitrella brassicaformis CCMP3155]